MLTKEMKHHPRLNEISGKEKEEADEWIDEAVQTILNRIIFCRTVEDMGQIQFSLDSQLKEWEMKKSVPLMEHLSKFFRDVANHYDSGLFLRHDSEALTICDSILQDLITQIYMQKETNLHWNFKALASDNDILGLAYEQYLGTTLTEKTARIKENKIQRKKMGIYYTPKYIVEYIVSNTLSEKLKACKGPDDLLKIKVLDPACGSGSFLKEAYRRFKKEIKKRNWGLQTYMDGDTGKNISIYDAILKNCIYGVDLDKKACEIAKLNLLIMAAEGGTHQLPNIDKMIKQGNSLIDDPKIIGLRLAFNWKEQFPEVFNRNLPGFDVVVGNPPWGSEFNELEKEYLKKEYKYSITGKIDSYKYFYEKCFALVRNPGFISLITPNTFLYNIQSKELRLAILNDFHIVEAIELRKNIFDAAPDVVPAILCLKYKKTDKDMSTIAKVAYPDKKIIDLSNLEWMLSQKINSSLFTKDKYNKINLRSDLRFSSINSQISVNPLLGEFFKLKQGTKPYGVKTNKKAGLLGDKKIDSTWDEAINGRDIGRYSIQFQNLYVKNCKQLHSRIPQDMLDSEKIYFQRMRKISLFPRIIASYDNKEYHGLYTCSVIVAKSKDCPISLKYLLGLLNSNLINLWYKYYDTDIEIKLDSVKNVPIRLISKEEQIPLIRLVDQMLLLNKKSSKTTEASDDAKAIINEREKINAEIDNMVYKLYGLEPDDIKIIKSILKSD